MFSEKESLAITDPPFNKDSKTIRIEDPRKIQTDSVSQLYVGPSGN
jgi:hypothetical protein